MKRRVGRSPEDFLQLTGPLHRVKICELVTDQWLLVRLARHSSEDSLCDDRASIMLIAVRNDVVG